MDRMHAPLRLLAAAAFSVGAAQAAHALTLGVTEGVTYRATDNEIEARFAPIAEALAKALKQPVTIKVLSKYDAMRDALARQQIDLAFIHPAHVALEAAKASGWRTVAWTSGYTDYKVTLLCKQDQPISDWKAVNGKSLVTPDPDSITAVMTRAMLREHGVQPANVKLQTTRYQDAVPFYVDNGFAVYGATAARGVVKTWKAGGGKTCADSRPLPIKQWLASGRLDDAAAAAVRETLLALGSSDAGKKALAASGYAGFVAPSAEQEKALMAWLGL